MVTPTKRRQDMPLTLSLLRRDATIFADAKKSIYSAHENREVHFIHGHKLAVLFPEEDMGKIQLSFFSNRQSDNISHSASADSSWHFAEWVEKLQISQGLIYEIVDREGFTYEIDLNNSNGTGLSKTGNKIALDEFSILSKYKEIKGLYNDLLGQLADQRKKKRNNPDDYQYMNRLGDKAHQAMVIFSDVCKLAEAEELEIFNDTFFTYNDSYETKTLRRLQAIQNELDYALVLNSVVTEKPKSKAALEYESIVNIREATRKKGQAYLNESKKHPQLVDSELKNNVRNIVSNKIDRLWQRYTKAIEDFVEYVDENPYEMAKKGYADFEHRITQAQNALNKAVSDDALRNLLATKNYLEHRIK